MSDIESPTDTEIIDYLLLISKILYVMSVIAPKLHQQLHRVVFILYTAKNAPK